MKSEADTRPSNQIPDCATLHPGYACYSVFYNKIRDIVGAADQTILVIEALVYFAVIGVMTDESRASVSLYGLGCSICFEFGCCIALWPLEVGRNL